MRYLLRNLLKASMQTINLKHLPLHAESRVLDLGCGEGRHALAAYWLSPAATVVAVDLNTHDLRQGYLKRHEWLDINPRHACHFIAADGLNLPFANNSFDAVICSEVLEHIDQYQSMLREIERLIKPGGHLAVSVPRAWPEKICWMLSAAYHEVEGGHVRIFKARELRQSIECLGFNFSRRHWAHALHVPYWWLRCLFWRQHRQIGIVRWYHRFLVWDLMQKPWLTQSLEKCLNPVMGKSVVMYFIKGKSTP